jgi:hypothetical protein
MRKLIAISFVSFVTLGVNVPSASAWWLWDGLCGHGCCAPICCRQYNAFSPFCCEGAYYPMPGYGQDGSAACSFSGDQGYLGELPAAGAMGDAVPNGQAVPPANNQPTNNQPAPGSSAPAPRDNPQTLRPAMPPQAFPTWGTGMMNPGNVPGTYPGFPSYGPVNGNGLPSYNPGFTGYGPTNGFGH